MSDTESKEGFPRQFFTELAEQLLPLFPQGFTLTCHLKLGNDSCSMTLTVPTSFVRCP